MLRDKVKKWIIGIVLFSEYGVMGREYRR